MLHRLLRIQFLATLLFALLLLGACSDDTDPPLTGDKRASDTPDAAVTDLELGPPVTFTLATFNVRNFFDATDDPETADDVPSASELASKIDRLGAALRLLDADVLALQEVENKALLERLNQQELGALGYEHLRLVAGNDYRGMSVALLSRFPVPKAISHSADRFPGVDGDSTTYGFSRDCLEAYIEVSLNRQLVLLINHLRATDYSELQESLDRRHAQAQRVREIVDEILDEQPAANLAVIGDLNDTPESKTLQLIQRGSPTLSDLLESQPADERYTFTFQGQGEQIDYILAAPGLAEDILAGSAQARHESVFSAASDHYPVQVRLTLR